MIVYHGTTRRRADRICVAGFLPRKPSRRVWFAKGKGYAEGRARTQARRSRDHPVVLTCDIDLAEIRRLVGAKRVFQRSGVIAIGAPVPATVLRSFPGQAAPTSPDQLARWINRALGLKQHKGVSKTHPGLLRLSRWACNRIASRPGSYPTPAEMLHMARQWLGEYFDGVDVDLDTLSVSRRYTTIEVKVDVVEPEPDPREAEALECLEADKPKRRIRGLELLAELDDPDLADWCGMFLDDDSPAVQAAALRTMLRCEDADAEIVAPLAESEEAPVRAAAVAAMARFSDPDEWPRWFERGLKDPSPHVRLATAGQLGRLDPKANRAIFELALYDSNPDVVRRARKLAAGKGFARITW